MEPNLGGEARVGQGLLGVAPLLTGSVTHLLLDLTGPDNPGLLSLLGVEHLEGSSVKCLESMLRHLQS